MKHELRERQDRAALVTELQAAGAVVKGNAVRCPFHGDRHASAGIFQDEEGVWRFRCNAASCGAAGDVYDIRSRVAGRALADVLKEAGPGDHRSVHRPADRGFASLEDLRVAVARGGEIEAEYVYSPTFRVFRLKTAEGKTFRQCSRHGDQWSMTAPAKPWPLYRANEAAKHDEILVVEGEKCTDVLWGIGVAAVTSPCGAGKAGYADWSPLGGKRVYLWPDYDEPGFSHMKDICDILGGLSSPPAEIWVVHPPDIDLEPGEDVADLVTMCGHINLHPAGEVAKACSRAKRFHASGGLADRLERQIEGTWATVPWPVLERLSRALLPQTITVLCGSPGAAKSFFVLTAFVRWFGAGVSAALFALEEDITYHLTRILAIREQNIDLLNPEWIQCNAGEVRAAYERQKDFLDRIGRRIWTAKAAAPTTLTDVSIWVRDRARSGCRAVLVDPITATTAADKPWIEDARFHADVRATMAAYESSLLLVTHPKKGSKGVGLDDLAGGAVYQRLSQTILWMERHKSAKSVTVETACGRTGMDIAYTLHIAKSRNGAGHGMGLAYKIDWPTIGIVEQGLITEKGTL